MEGTIPMKQYKTDPNKRCMYCKGREVITINEDDSAESNLLYANGFYYCKDKKECEQNVKAENTIVTYSMDEKGEIVKKKVLHFGENVFEVSKNDI